MADGGTGELFTSDSQEFSSAERTAKLPVFSSLAFTYGATLDLDGNGEFFVKDLAGSPAVVNAGTINVTNNWTIFADDFPMADDTVRNPMTVAGVLAFAEGATFSVDDASGIARDAEGFAVATATGGITGLPEPADEDCPVELVVDGKSLLMRRKLKPMVIVFR